ncbi:MAG: citramalate synthase [Oscillospiraceae bacterium]|nr:citramalate synthase [Oscillospiraceae bacterium]
MKIELYDTTLRDGAQSPGISFTAEDKLRIMAAIDEFGIPYIEAGNPGSNPKDMELFEKAKTLSLKNSKLCAFCSTCRAGAAADRDEALLKTIGANTEIVALCGKSWLLHVEKIIKTTADENLRIISDSVKFLKENQKTVFFDAEHFFDGYADNPGYALQVLRAAEKAGASAIILCDTNGGTMPDEIQKAACAAKTSINLPLGIHCHDDNGLAVAGTLTAVKSGASIVQGTINGMGERCGNANLCIAIPNLQLKMGYFCLSAEKLRELGPFARRIAEISNIAFDENMPYVGGHAFTHKAGMHIDAVNKAPASFEHIDPAIVGNVRNTLVSEFAGRSALINKMKQIAPQIAKDSPELAEALRLVKSYENDGYQFENAEGSLYLLLLKSLKKRKAYFSVETFKLVLSEPDAKSGKPGALVKVKVGGKEEMTAAEGDGPVNALDKALRRALTTFYPKLGEMKLVDFKVRVLNSNAATAAKVRVLIESSDNSRTWRTVGVSTDIIEASWNALLDSVECKLSLDDGLII